MHIFFQQHVKEMEVLIVCIIRQTFGKVKNKYSIINMVCYFATGQDNYCRTTKNYLRQFLSYCFALSHNS